MTNYVLHAEPVEVNISPQAFRVSAEEHYAYVESSPIQRHFSPVPYALLCQAIELKLKSHHCTKMNREAVKRSFGHDLIRAYDALDNSLRVLDCNDVAVLSQANNVYNDDKAFHYVQPFDLATQCTRYPDLEKLKHVTKKLLDVPTAAE